MSLLEDGVGLPEVSIRRVGPYELKKTLGEGSTGRVKLGVHVETGFTVAIKIISKQSLKVDRELQEKVEREIAIMKLINHPHVLTLYDVYENDESLFLVLEHVEGGELFDYLVDKGKLSENEALEFFQQIISAVDFCQHHYICHRDLKPENLLLDSHNQIKIADFGMASLQLKDSFCATSCGSPHYASPEVVRGDKYNGKAADVWSCGVILFALLTGCLPFDDEDIQILLMKVKVGSFKIPNYVSESAQDLINSLIVVDPDKRFTIEDVKNHPWFQSNDKYDEMVEPPTFDDLPPVLRKELVDEDVLSSMCRLGCFNNEDDICERLATETGNIEKMLYYLLLERKVTRPAVEDYDTLTDSDVHSPRKRTDSCISLEQFEPLLINRTKSNDGEYSPNSPPGRRMSRAAFKNFGGEKKEKARFERTMSSDTLKFASPKSPTSKASRKSSIQFGGSLTNLDQSRRASVTSHRHHVQCASPPVQSVSTMPKKTWIGTLFGPSSSKIVLKMETTKDIARLKAEMPKIFELNYIVAKPNHNSGLFYKCKYDCDEDEVKFKVSVVQSPTIKDNRLLTFSLLSGSDFTFQSLFDNIYRGLRIVSDSR